MVSCVIIYIVKLTFLLYGVEELAYFEKEE